MSATRETARRLRRVNWVSATSFLIGGSLFALGAALALAGTSARTTCWIYLIGGFFFSTGAYAALLQVVNAPRTLDARGMLAGDRWRWWAREPRRLEWLSAAALFVGTLVFAVLLVDSFIEGLSAGAENRLIWSPDMVGCTLFLVSGQMAIAEACHRAWCWRSRDLGWWIVMVNQLGSVLFMASAAASFARPVGGEVLSESVANWGTLTGALCFALAGGLQEVERPGSG
ncbi:MAG TPA: hypothetical protein VGF09_00295 [Solirubrobacterales bacterium]